MPGHRVRSDDGVLLDGLLVERAAIVDVDVVLLGVSEGVSERGAPAGLLGVGFLGRQQYFGGFALEAAAAQDQVTETRNVITPRLTAVHPERAIGTPVAQSQGKAVVAQYPRERRAGVPVTKPVAHADAELVRIRRFQVIVHQVGFLTHVSPGDQGLEIGESVEILRVPGKAWRTRMATSRCTTRRRVEIDRDLG